LTPLLAADHLSFSYATHPVLRDIQLTLKPAEVVALIGPNGSGKSTLIKSLIGHLRAAGSITWNDKPLAQWRRRDLARLVSYLPQSPVLEEDQNVADVLRLGRAPYWGAFGIESHRDMQVVREVSALLGLNDLLTRPMRQLSGGQRQRVFIGRCLAQEPRAMLLDEPNTFLDLKHQVELLQLLQRLSRDRSIAVLMASHDLNLAAAFADRLILLDNGSIAAAGPASQVLDPTILSRVYGLPIQVLAGRVFPAVGSNNPPV
jgi:iron complex transport system ATP-binding protein